MRHPSIVQFVGAAFGPHPKTYMILEYMKLGNLSHVIHSQIELSWLLRMKMSLDISRVMQFLHYHKITHRDLKTANLMVSEHFKVKLADFGEAKESSTELDTVVGTRPYSTYLF